MRSLVHVGLVLALALTAGVLAPACGSDARLTDTCRTIENERCKRASECKLEGFAGDVDSCIRFYDVQCGRGVQDPVKEPTKAEITNCTNAIKTDCAAVLDPSRTPACSFLTANDVQPDTGTPEAAAETGTDAGAETD